MPKQQPPELEPIDAQMSREALAKMKVASATTSTPNGVVLHSMGRAKKGQKHTSTSVLPRPCQVGKLELQQKLPCPVPWIKGFTEILTADRWIGPLRTGSRTDMES